MIAAKSSGRSLAATGGIGTLTWSMLGTPSLPSATPDLQLKGYALSTGGVLTKAGSGYTAHGTYPLHIQVTDSSTPPNVANATLNLGVTCPVSATVDSDGDGLPDCWEIGGIDGDGDGNSDYMLKGADPKHSRPN